MFMLMRYIKQLGELRSPIGAGPRILVLIGRTDMFPTWRTSPSSLKDEWYACQMINNSAQRGDQKLTGMVTEEDVIFVRDY